MRRLWPRRAAEEGAPATPRPDEGEAEDSARPREALAFSLRSWGQFAIELENEDSAGVRDRFEQWASTLQSRAGEPVTPNYDGIERFVLDQRKTEQRSVAQQVGSMREALWSFVECFHRSLSNDQTLDEKARHQVARLHSALAKGDGTTLRHEVLSTIQLVQSSIERRHERYRKQVDVLSEKVSRLSHDLVKAQLLAASDPLSGLANRTAFDTHLAQMAQLGPMLPQPPVLLLMDIDHFKWVNDRFGHPVGDEVVRRISARLRAELRGRGDLVARVGGDEFAAVLRDVAPKSELLIADRVLTAIRDLGVAVDGQPEPARCSLSMGIARLGLGESHAFWLRRADSALYEAKHRGRDRAVSAEQRDAELHPEPNAGVPSDLKSPSPS